MRKGAAALGIGIALPLLGLAGYVPNEEQSDQVVLALRGLYALVPCVCNMVAIAIATRSRGTPSFWSICGGGW